jgi:hypothetical protein
MGNTLASSGASSLKKCCMWPWPDEDGSAKLMKLYGLRFAYASASATTSIGVMVLPFVGKRGILLSSHMISYVT